ncbi:hypothetical protein MAPG_10858 [Magnaporthiopsis poae ATCC 64411]|uniref:Uncharacterized protein n=1 Tax=Magnaporthiopsis poae (strain ATCC 64411 / 73-15) TaxID=644358 RepID=A0A0C4EDQ2_MAGP6|nr:hypothetical protein MAPG_10858 [Magnaporthiopsis poae ATCC 64411]
MSAAFGRTLGQAFGSARAKPKPGHKPAAAAKAKAEYWAKTAASLAEVELTDPAVSGGPPLLKLPLWTWSQGRCTASPGPSTEFRLGGGDGGGDGLGRPGAYLSPLVFWRAQKKKGKEVGEEIGEEIGKEVGKEVGKETGKGRRIRMVA